MNGKDATTTAANTASHAEPVDTDISTKTQGMTDKKKNILSEHKGKLAIGVAATLGIMIFYNWRQKQLSKEDPEEYARLQRIKDSVRADLEKGDHGNGEKHRKAKGNAPDRLP